MFHVPVQLGIQAVTCHQEVAVATAMFLTFTSLGGSVGSAIAGSIWTNLLPIRLQEYLPGMDEKERRRMYNDFRYAMSFPSGSVEREGIIDAYVDVMRRLTAAATFAALPMMVLVFLMKEVKLDTVASTQDILDEHEECLGQGSSRPISRNPSRKPVQEHD
jgi:hypothetical protein